MEEIVYGRVNGGKSLRKRGWRRMCQNKYERDKVRKGVWRRECKEGNLDEIG